MRLRRASLSLLVLLAAGCSSDPSGDGVTSFAPGAAGTSAQPSDPGTAPAADGAAGSGAAPVAPGTSVGSDTESGPDPVALDPEAPVTGNEGATGAGDRLVDAPAQRQ